MSENRLELYRQHTASQQKFAYFLLAAVGACIGFALTQTKDASIHLNQVPLAAAMMCWALSFCCGCVHLRRGELAMYANMGLINLQEGIDPVAGRDPNLIQYGVGIVRDVIEGHNNLSSFASRWQFRLLVLGVLCYVGWHILDMWSRTPSVPPA